MIHGVTDIVFFPIIIQNKPPIQEKLLRVLIQFERSGSSPPVCGLQGFELCGSPVE